MSKFLDEKGLRQLIELIRNLNSEGDSEGMMLSAGEGIEIDSEGKINVKFDDTTIKLNDDNELELVNPFDSPIKVLKTLDRHSEISLDVDYALVENVENELGIPLGDLAELYELVDLNGNSISYNDAVNYLNKGGTLVVKYSGVLYYLYNIGPRPIISGRPATTRDCIGNEEIPESYGLHYFN